MVLVGSQPSCKYLANAISLSVNLTATGRWCKGMNGAAASPLKNITNKRVAWRGVSDTLLTLNGILKRTSSVWRQLFHCLVFRVGEMGEMTHGFRHILKDKFGYVYITCTPPLWSGGQSFWLQIQRSRVRFTALPDFLSSSGSGTRFTQPREVNWGATWLKK